jgi:hypothetical protein
MPDVSVFDRIVAQEADWESQKPMSGRGYITEKERVNLLYAQNGATFLDGASYAYGRYVAAFHVTNTTYTNSNSFVNWDGTAAVSSYVFPAGSWIYGVFDNPRITSGTVILVKG